MSWDTTLTSKNWNICPGWKPENPWGGTFALALALNCVCPWQGLVHLFPFTLLPFININSLTMKNVCGNCKECSLKVYQIVIEWLKRLRELKLYRKIVPLLSAFATVLKSENQKNENFMLTKITITKLLNRMSIITNKAMVVFGTNIQSG